MKVFRAISNFFTDAGRFVISMLTGPNGDVSSKRVNGTELIQAAVVLGFFIAFHRTRETALEVLKLFLYMGAAILGVGNLMENIKMSPPKRPLVGNPSFKDDDNAGGGKVNGPSL